MRYQEIRDNRVEISIAPPLYFNPVLPGMPIDRAKQPFKTSQAPTVTRAQESRGSGFLARHASRLTCSNQAGESVDLTECTWRGFGTAMRC